MNNKVQLAHLPTPLQKLETLSKKYSKNIYIKRDDFTGIELSGNKARKLEYLFFDAIKNGYDTVLTYGGTQSNHARSTAAAAKKLGLNCILILENTYKDSNEGNLFLNRMLGADIYFAEPGSYVGESALQKKVIAEYEARGKKVYNIPVGGSNALGSLGYVDAAGELLTQLEAAQINADLIVSTVGSGGTYAGLLYGLKDKGFAGDVLGVNISRDAESYRTIIVQLMAEIDTLLHQTTNFNEAIYILDGYVGEGYAKTSREVMAFMQQFAEQTGIFLDPVYTGKAFYGFFDALEKGQNAEAETIVLLHTGGIFGYREDQRQLIFQ